MFRNIFFDWSGTLANDLPPVLDATNRLLEHHGRPPLSELEFRETFRLPFKGFYDEVLPEIPLDDLERRYAEYFAASTAAVVLLPHAREFLEFCRGHGVRLFVLSSARGDFLEAQARALGVLDYFETIHAGVVDKRLALPELLARHGMDPAATAFIGDMEHDVESALAAGVHAIAVLTGYDPPAKLMRAGPEVVVSDLGRLQRLLALRADARREEDTIDIDGLEVDCRIGAGESERAKPQRLLLDMRLWLPGGLRGLGDELERTVDYHEVALAVRELAAARPRRLVETLADEIQVLLLRRFGIARARVRVRKFILPFVGSVGVTLGAGSFPDKQDRAATLDGAEP